MRHNTFILFFFLTASVLFAQENRSKVGIRPWPRDSVHEMTGGGRVDHWDPGIGNYDAMLKADDYTAMHIDVVFGYDGVFKTNQRFFEHYIHQQGGFWVDPNPETNTYPNLKQAAKTPHLDQMAFARSAVRFGSIQRNLAGWYIR